MGLIQNVKLLFKFNGLYAKIKESYMTKGMKSTEFWLTIIAGLTTVFQTFQGSLDPKTAAIIGAVLTCVYTVARSFVKSSEATTDTTIKTTTIEK